MVGSYILEVFGQFQPFYIKPNLKTGKVQLLFFPLSDAFGL